MARAARPSEVEALHEPHRRRQLAVDQRLVGDAASRRGGRSRARRRRQLRDEVLVHLLGQEGRHRRHEAVHGRRGRSTASRRRPACRRRPRSSRSGGGCGARTSSRAPSTKSSIWRAGGHRVVVLERVGHGRDELVQLRERPAVQLRTVGAARLTGVRRSGVQPSMLA